MGRVNSLPIFITTLFICILPLQPLLFAFDIHYFTERSDGKRTLINEILEVSDEKKKEMIDAVIKVIWIESIDKNHFRITVENKLGYIDETWFEYSSRGRRIELFLHYPDGRILDLTPSLKNHRRY